MSLGGGYDDERPGPEDGVFYGGTGTTRTRLPEGDDAYGGPRRPARASRSLVTVVGVVVLLIAAIAFANQGGESSDGGESGGSKPGANPTAASGEDAVTQKDGGVPVGFKQSRTGAQSAAANYLVALGSDGMYQKDSRDQIVAVVYDPPVQRDRMRELDKVYSDPKFLTSIGLNEDGKAPAGQTFVTRFSPVGSKVESYSGKTATVSVWYSALFGLAGEGAQNPVTESWYTNTFTLRWDGHWRVVDFKQKDGPVPVGKDQSASTAKDMSDAVKEFGGFTYAR
ncbi:hypothetical protein G6045_29985 [Streptomyces sp. YC504]|uniref:DUF8175 domain-containing protein n=1 Tax=Streptomyces mesophilus TaxID=1775132 RepID=A0A6G4XSS6_9ACTN|nr:hypothetical protein [Streptomyces mesophilus]NGO79857.1 hypothetical protein [Streptomyces mesophilus]